MIDKSVTSIIIKVDMLKAGVSCVRRQQTGRTPESQSFAEKSRGFPALLHAKAGAGFR